VSWHSGFDRAGEAADAFVAIYVSRTLADFFCGRDRDRRTCTSLVESEKNRTEKHELISLVAAHA
jgi:hypothetical protein